MQTDIMHDLQAVFDAYVIAHSSSDATGCAAVFLDHAEMYSPYGYPALGREAIRKTHVQWRKEQAESKVVTVQSAGGAERGDGLAKPAAGAMLSDRLHGRDPGRHSQVSNTTGFDASAILPDGTGDV